MSITAPAIIGLLRCRHPVPEWAVFEELEDVVGFGWRRMDLFAVNCWRSKGYRAVAYEVKVSRADFKREMEHPDKRAICEKVAHDCYFATPAGLIKPEELPVGWGLMEVNGSAMKIVRVAPQRPTVEWPMPFMLAIARRCSDPSTKVPPAIWRSAGQELTEADVLTHIEQVAAKNTELRYSSATLKAIDEALLEYKSQLDFARHVADKMGSWFWDTAAFDQWLAGNAGLIEGPVRRRIQDARLAAQQLVDALKEVTS